MHETSHPAAVRAVMLFVAEPRVVATWYAEAFGDGSTRVVSEAAGLCHFQSGDVEFAFHPADHDLNPPGGSTVVYWAADHVLACRESLVASGARHHRGPLKIADNRYICQLVDPFGSIFGLDGPA
jgi:hypothetical protein